jgi:hypothetical protein
LPFPIIEKTSFILDVPYQPDSWRAIFRGGLSCTADGIGIGVASARQIVAAIADHQKIFRSAIAIEKELLKIWRTFHQTGLFAWLQKMPVHETI